MRSLCLLFLLAAAPAALARLSARQRALEVSAPGALHPSEKKVHTMIGLMGHTAKLHHLLEHGGTADELEAAAGARYALFEKQAAALADGTGDSDAVVPAIVEASYALTAADRTWLKDRCARWYVPHRRHAPVLSSRR